MMLIIQVSVLSLPLETGTTNWSDNQTGSVEARSGFVISQLDAGAQQDLFRFIAVQAGVDIMKDYMIAIEEIREPANPNVSNFGTFTVCVKDMAGQTVRKIFRM